MLNKIAFAICLFLSAVFCSQSLGAQDVALKTNALLWASMTPNFGCEIVTGEHSSIEVSAFGHKNPYGQTSEILAVQPEYRYWFNGRPMVREYIGLGALLTTYNSTLRNEVFDGDALGIGITGGYVFALARRLNIEVSGSFGLLLFRQKQYFVQDNYDDYFVTVPHKINSRGYKLFPVDLGISLTYIIQ